MSATLSRRVLSLLALFLFALPLAADRLVTTDGRVLKVKKARQLENGNYVLTFEAGSIECAGSAIASVEIEGDMSDYVPQNEDERKKLERGYVRYDGRWMSKASYENELRKEAEARREEVAELAERSQFVNGWEEETKNFVVKTNTSPELLEYYCNLLEAFYKLIDKEFRIKRTPTLRGKKMRVNIYKSAEDFRDGTGSPRGVLGYFSLVDHDLNFFHEYEEPMMATWVALHEGTHLMTFLIDPQSYPRIWYNEGVADYLGSCEVEVDKRGKISLTPGALQLDRTLTVQQAIKDDDYVRLEDLFQTDRSNFSGFEYAHAWSFIYFLNNTPRYQKGFKRFFNDIYTLPKGVEYSYEASGGLNVQGNVKYIENDEVRRVLLDALKVDDVAGLEKEWLEFMKNIELDAPVARFKRAYNSLRRGDVDVFEQSEKDLDEAIAGGYEDARAYWARAVIKTWNAKAGFKAGISDLRKAVELEPLNALYRFTLGQALAGYEMSVGGFWMRVGAEDDDDRKLYGQDEEFEEAELQLGLALELDPENPRYREFYREFEKLFSRHLDLAD